MNDLRFFHGLSTAEKSFLQRLPSVKNRHIDIEQICQNNEVVGLKDQRDRIVLITCYHQFDDFMYLHTTIGRDEYKDILFEYLFATTTKIAPSYFILFDSAASIESSIKCGAVEVFLDSIEICPDTFINQVNGLMGTRLYWHDNILMDHNDPAPVKNPLFYCTAETLSAR